jgi:nicotinamidase-related amidase
VIDAVGGTSLEAHRAALERVTQAGTKPISWVQLICELQRDWQRKRTAREFANILFTVEGHEGRAQEIWCFRPSTALLAAGARYRKVRSRHA